MSWPESFDHRSQPLVVCQLSYKPAATWKAELTVPYLDGSSFPFECADRHRHWNAIAGLWKEHVDVRKKPEDRCNPPRSMPDPRHFSLNEDDALVLSSEQELVSELLRKLVNPSGEDPCKRAVGSHGHPL
jgi:hypothetical protein